MYDPDSVSTEKLNELITEATASGGSELANYQLFVGKRPGNPPLSYL